ncbi:MAG TPA: RnfH family protein [Acidiferrobacter sp.]|nr:RnfH family protein [Acidiferrobacter sp.]
MAPAKITVEVVHVGTAPLVRPVLVGIGASVFEAIRQSTILAERPGIDLRVQRVGIFGRLVALSEPVAAGDRIEIYEPLLEDPKESRRKRARAKAAPRRYAAGSGAVGPRSS